MTSTFFVTGTDTSVGKTYVSCRLLDAFNNHHLSTFAIKPIASGCYRTKNGELRNDDAMLLMNHASIKMPYEEVNPIAFLEPIAPHIAAKINQFELSKDYVRQLIHNTIQKDADINLIEGAGGFALPLNDDDLYSDVIIELNIPIVLVVGIKLGCLNHALLTCHYIQHMGGQLLGWIANCLEPASLVINENINTLTHKIQASCLGIVPYNDVDNARMNVHLIIDKLRMQ